MKIFIGADHKGFELKEKLKTWLLENDNVFTDVGAESFDQRDDYPIYAQRVAQNVAESWNRGEEDTLGIVICGSGVGVDIVANKFDGIRAGLGINSEQVKSAKHDDNINVLAIAADETEEGLARDMVKNFIETEFESIDRRNRRLNEIKNIEEDN